MSRLTKEDFDKAGIPASQRHATTVATPSKSKNISEINIKNDKVTKILSRTVTSDLLEELKEGILEDASELEFPNHSPESNKDWLTIANVIKRNKFYENNCHAISSELAQFMDELGSYTDGFKSAETIQLDYNNGVHVAVLVEDEDGEKTVVDYTARQFDKSLPVPLMLKQNDWEELIDYYIEKLHGDYRSESK